MPPFPRLTLPDIGTPSSITSELPSASSSRVVLRRLTPKAQPQPAHLKTPTTASLAFVDLVPLPMCVVDLHGAILCQNSEFSLLVLLPPGCPMGDQARIVDAVSQRDSGTLRRMLRSVAFSKSGRVSRDLETRMLEGAERSLYWTLSCSEHDNFIAITLQAPIDDKTSSSSLNPCMRSMSADYAPDSPLSQQLSLREERKANQALAATLEVKRSFVRHVSHEIRTPLNIVLSGLEVMESSLDRSSHEFNSVLADVQSAVGVAVELVNDLLTYEKIDGDMLKLNRVFCDVAPLVRQTFNLFSVQAQRSCIAYSLDVEGDDDGVLRAELDPTKFVQVIRNLLSNAIKFTPSGGRVHCRLARVSGNTSGGSCLNERIRLEVSDSGPGMTLAQRGLLFKEMVQFDAAALQNGQGSGFGLFISQKIIEMHEGGAIGVCMQRSEEEGSLFFVELDLAPRRQDSPDSATTNKGKSVSSFRSEVEVVRIQSIEQPQPIALKLPLLAHKPRVLLVDDATTCRKFHARMVDSFFTCEEAVNGKEAVSKVLASMDENRPYDAVLMDRCMPVMNGHEAARCIRERGFRGKIFGITGNGFQSEVNDFLSYGVDEVLVKPLSRQHFNHIIEAIVASSDLGAHTGEKISK